MDIKKLIVFFLKNSPRELGRTELMKYIYLFEYYYFQLYKKQFTNLEFIRYKYGPNETAVVDATYELQDEGIIRIHEYTNYYNSSSYDHSLEGEVLPSDYNLPSDAEFVAGFVCDLLWNQNYRGVLNIAYSTPPMKEIIGEEEAQGTKLYGRVVDMSKSGPIFRSSRKERMEARKRLKSREEKRGSDEEYYAHLLEQYEKFEDTRRRANDAECKL